MTIVTSNHYMHPLIHARLTVFKPFVEFSQSTVNHRDVQSLHRSSQPSYPLPWVNSSCLLCIVSFPVHVTALLALPLLWSARLRIADLFLKPFLPNWCLQRAPHLMLVASSSTSTRFNKIAIPNNKFQMASGQGSHWLIESPTLFSSTCSPPLSNICQFYF